MKKRLALILATLGLTVSTLLFPVAAHATSTDTTVTAQTGSTNSAVIATYGDCHKDAVHGEPQNDQAPGQTGNGPAVFLTIGGNLVILVPNAFGGGYACLIVS